jgi:uncharacterized protein (TIGR00645 family)
MTTPPHDGDQPLWNNQLFWLVIIHMTFALSALLMAVIDRIAFAPHRNH